MGAHFSIHFVLQRAILCSKPDIQKKHMSPPFIVSYFLISLFLVGLLDSSRSKPAEASPTQSPTAFPDKAAPRPFQVPQQFKGSEDCVWYGATGLNSSSPTATAGSWPNHLASQSQFPHLFNAENNRSNLVRCV